jgi:hypothetical protein
LKRLPALCLLCLVACSEKHAPALKPHSVVHAVASAPRAALDVAARPSASAQCSAHPQTRAPQLEHAATSLSALSPKPGLWLADEHYALLSAAPEASWAEGAPSFAAPDSALRAVALARLPKSLRAWLGRPVRVLGANGAVCDTRLQRFAVRAQITPDPTTAEVWDGCAEPPLAPAAIAERIWRSAAVSGRTLVAEFSAPCKGALLAVDPDLPVPLIRAPEPASAELGQRALSDFQKLPAYAELQARFKTEQPEAEGAWDDHDARRGVWSLTLPGHAPLLFVSVEVGTPCSKFSGSLSALWQDAGPASLTLLATPPALDTRRLTPSAVIDLDGSGNAAVLLGPDGQFAARALLARPASGGGYVRALLSSVPFFAAPC